METIQEILFALVFLSLLATLLSGFTLRRHRARRSWPAVPAQVASVQFFQDTDSVKAAYTAFVYLTYKWQGQTFTSGKLHDARKVFSSRARAEAYLTAHPIGQPHTIRVNPREPSDAVVHSVDPHFAALFYRYSLPIFVLALVSFVTALLLG